MTLALLITAVGGAWADDLSNKIWKPGDTFNIGAAWLYDDDKGTATVYHSINEDNTVPAINDWTFDSNRNQWKISGFIKVDKVDFDGDVISLEYSIELYLSAPEGKQTADVKPIGFKIISGAGTKESPYTLGLVYEEAPAEPDVEVTLNAAEEGATFTEATFAMPAFDATAEYELVRDLTQQVTFGGIPTGDGLVVKKGGTAYEFVTAPDFTLTDPLAAADAQNIIQADDITITVGKMVEVEGFEGYRQFDEATAVSLADFLANPQPGTYKMKATATADGPYDGTVYSAEFTTVEKNDLLIQPADEYSKGKLTEVTVAGAAQTLDADGKVTTTAEPGKEVKLKAKTGYVIEKVEAKKPVTSAIVNPQVGQIIGSDGKNYAADATLPSGVTAVAMIAYVGSETDDTDYTGGLAIALSDEGRMNWSTAKSTCEGKTAVTGAKWCLPSQNQWKAMFKANGGSESSYTGLNTAISTAGGTALQQSCYWSSTEHGEVNAYYVYLFSGNAYFSNASKGIDYLVRAVLAF